MTTHDIHMTNELHVIRAHLLHYESLLEDFSNTVRFVQDTPNPALQPQVGTPISEEFDMMKAHSAMMMKRECGNLLSDIDRLESSRRMQAKRLKNVMDLVWMFCTFFSLLGTNPQRRVSAASILRIANECRNLQSLLYTIVLVSLSCFSIDLHPHIELAMKIIAYLTMAFLPASFVAVSRSLSSIRQSPINDCVCRPCSE